MAERVDVCIVGSGFGGSIAAWRLAELYRAADQDAERRRARARRAPRAHRLPPVDGRRPPLRRLRADPGRRARRSSIANLVGGGSNLYLAASLRSPSETFERTDHHPDDGPRRRIWPRALSRQHARPLLRPRRGGAAGPPALLEGGLEVGRGVGGDAARGRAHLRPRPGRDRLRALRRRQVVLHGLRLRRQELADHQLPALGRAPRGRGAAAGPGRRGRARRARGPTAGSSAAVAVDPETKQPADPGRDRVQGRDPRRGGDGDDRRSCCARARTAACRASPRTSARHLGVNGDHVAAVEVDPKKARIGARPAGLLRRLPQGQADHDDELRLLGRQARQPPRRHPLHPAGDPPLPAHQLPLRRRPDRRPRADLVGAREEALDLDLVPPHRDPGDGRGDPRRRVLRRAADRQRPPAAERRTGRDRPLQLPAVRAVGAGPRARPTRRSGGSASGAASGRFLKLAETPGVYASHPLGRLPDGRRRRLRRRRRRAARSSATRASSAWTPRSSRRASGSTRR